jgi:hypothetical protein
MRVRVDERELRERLSPPLREPRFRQVAGNVANDPLCLSLFPMGTSYGEGLGEAGVEKIAGEQIQKLIVSRSLFGPEFAPG